MKWYLEGGEVLDDERRGVALISATYLGKGAGPLIAAAPELLEALRALLELPVAKGELKLLDRRIGTATANKAWLDARAAIAKAEGRS